MPYDLYSLDRIWEEIIIRAVWISAIMAGISIAICLLLSFIDTLYRRSIERSNRLHSSTPSQGLVMPAANNYRSLDDEMSERLANRLYDDLPISSGRLFTSRSENDVGD
jgi:hypothetical protein